MGNRRGLLVLGILCCLAIAEGDKKKCYTGCHGSNSNSYKYEEGTNYKYKLDGSTVTTIAGAQTDVSKLSLSADVDVSVQDKCAYVLKISQVQVSGPDGKKYSSFKDLEKHPVKFSFNDGRVQSEICSEEGDTQSALNLKRAIISLFQSTVHKDSGTTSHYETDIFGTCPTDFEFSKSGGTYKIKKTRSLNQCAFREKLNFPVISSSYSLNSEFQSSPILASSSKTEQQIQDGIIQSAFGEEQYHYQPHLSIESGATVTVKTKLTFVSQAKGAPIAANVNVPESIIFEAPHEQNTGSNINTIQQALQKAESSVEPTIQPSAAQDFSDLVEVLSQSKKEDILTVYGSVKAKDTAKKILLDGIARASSGDSVEVLSELAQANELTDFQKKFWFLNLGFIKHVTKGSLKAVLPLLDDNAPKSAYLGVGALAGRFCTQHDCENVKEFEDLVVKLAAPVYAGCKVADIEKENILIASLKGLHNVHHLTNEVAGKVAKCALDKSVKTRIRVAALETFQSDAGRPQFKEAAATILKDQSEDSEVRIKAYLSLAECPCNKVADVIKNVLDTEKVNQVGSFIVSHLRNLRATTNPDRAHSKYFLGQIYTKNKFPIDIRKFSQNQELSYSFDAINVGTAGETNVIYSQKSFFPRSLSLNLTTQIFGHAFNLFELNARTENVDYILEKYFGPKGYFPTHNPHDVFSTAYKSGYSIVNKIKERYENSVRPKRSIQDQTSTFANKVDFGVDSHDNDLDLDLSLKVYGSEVGWFTYSGNNKQFDPNDVIDKVFNKIDAAFDKAKNIDADYKKHTTFLDAEAIYPTGLGLPLKVNTRGSSALRVKVDGKFDIPAILKDPKNGHIKFQLIPSAAVELSGQLSIDAYAVEAGARISGTIHTSTGSDVSLKLLDGSGIDVKFGLPVKKQDIILFKSQIVAITKEEGQIKAETPVKFNAKRQAYKGCFDQLSEFIGLTFCGDISFPFDGQKALSPSYGPTSFSASIEKEDESLTAYHFKAYLDKKDPNQATFEILLDTPNSKRNRKISFVVEAAKSPNKRISAVFTSPFKTATLEGLVIQTDKEQSLSAKLLNDETEYSVKLGVNIEGDENHRIFKPLLEYKAPDFKIEKKGLIGIKGGKGSAQRAIAVDGIIKLDKGPDAKRTYTLQDVKVTTSRTQYNLEGTISHDNDQVETDLKVSYDKETFILKSKLSKAITDERKYAKAYIEFIPSQYPDFNIVIDYEGEKLKSSFENKVAITHGKETGSQDSKITINQFVKYFYENCHNFDFSTKNSITYPLVTLTGKLEGEATPKSLSYLLDGTYSQHQISSSLNAKTGINKPRDYEVDFKAKILDNSVQLQAKRDIINDYKSKFINSLEVKPGGKYQLNAVVNHNFQRDNLNAHIHADIKIPYDPKNVKFDAGAKNNKKEFFTEFKVVSGGDKKYIEIEAKYQKDKPAGQFVANLLPNFESQGSFTVDSSKGSGNFVFNFPKQERKIEGKGEVAIAGSKYTGSADICWDAIKNPSKSLKIETESVIQSNAIESKNVITYLTEHKTNINFKGIVSEQPNEEAIQTDAEIILPNGRKLTGKYHGKYSHQTDDYDGEIDTELCHYPPEGGAPVKAALKANGKNINLAAKTIDGQVTFSFLGYDGKDLKVHSVIKKILNGEKWTINGEGSVSGTYIKHPVNLKLDSEISEKFTQTPYTASDHTFAPASYHFQGSVGSEVSVDSNGKINGHQINNEIDIKLPSDYSVKTLKWTSVNYFDPKESVKASNTFNWNGDKFFKLIAEGAREEDGANAKLEWESHAKSARTLTTNVHYKPSSTGKKFDAALAFAYEGKTADANVKGEYIKESETAQVQVSGNLPEQGKFDIFVKNQAVNGGKGFKTDVNIVVNEKKITVTNHVELDPESPLVDLVAEHPQGKSRVFLKLEKKGDRHWAGESKVKWVGNGGGNLAIDGEAKFESVDDFFVKINADSPKLKVERYHVEVANKPAKGSSKKITFQAKSANKLIFAGSTTYNYKEDGNTKSLDGNGQIKIGEESHPLKFKYIREQLTADDQGAEDGNQVKINVIFGKSTYDILGKLTASTFHVKRNYCKEAGVCSKSEIISKIKKHSIQEYDYEFTVNLDLSKVFKDTDDLLLKIATKRNGFHFDHNFELQRSPESKIKYQIYVHDFQAGAVLTLPKRVIAAEFNSEIPKNKKHGVFRLDGSLWLNKQKAPTEKTSVAINVDMAKSGDGGSFSGEIRASHPALGKDLVVKGHTTVFDNWNKIVDAKIDFDVFATSEQKITVQYKSSKSKDKDSFSVQELFNVKGLIDLEYKRSLTANNKGHVNYVRSIHYIDASNNKKEGLVKIELSPSKVNYVFTIPEGTLLSVDYKKKGGANNIVWEGVYDVLGEKYGEIIEIKNKNNLKYTFIFDKEGKNKKFEAELGFAIGQVAEFTSVFDGKELGHLQVALDDGNFLKSTYRYSTNNFKDFIEVVRVNYIGAVKKYNKAFHDALDRLSNDVVNKVEEVQKALPNFSPVVKAYTEQIQALQQEVVNEKSIQEAADYIKGVLGVVLEQVVVVLEELAKATESVLAVFNEGTAKFNEAVKRLIPLITDSYEKITKATITFLEESLKFSVEVVNFLLDKIKEHEQEIQAIVSAATEFASEIGQLTAKSYVQIRKQVHEFVELFIEQVKALPIFGMIKERFEEISKNGIPDEIWNDYNEVVKQIQEMLPTAECSQFFGTLTSYIEKLLRNKPVDNGDTLRTLYKELVAAVNSILAFVQSHVPQEKLAIQPYYTYFPVPTLSIFKIPKGAFRFSPIQWFQSPDIPSVGDIFYTYKPTINPLDYIPPYKAHAYLVHGTEFFTFDREHIQFKGNCLYLLAQDFADGNFSISARVKGGKVEGIILSDKSDSIELTNKQTVIVNGAPQEFPAKQGDLVAWRRYPTSNIYHKAGARVYCTPNLHFCSFHVSGFYFGKTKGILGTINNEVYDELSLPSGNVAGQLDEFVNAYALDGCSVSIVSETDTPNSYCSAIFNSDSSLSGCYPYVDFHHYLHACKHLAGHKAEGKDKEEVACEVAYAYYEACSDAHATVSVPSQCIKCNVAGKVLEEDDEATITTPQKSADIVLVVEQVEQNEEVFNSLITPLVNTITKDFAQQGITDVHFSLIGFNAANTKWPQHYTTNGKIDFTGKSSIYFSKKPEPDTAQKDKYYEKLKELKHKFDVEIGNTQHVIAFTEAHEYPFRPDAVKAVVGVLGSPCEKSALPISLQQARMIWSYIVNKLSGIEFHLIAPVENLQNIEKDSKVAASIVGFNNDRVYTFSDAKKKAPSSDISPFSLTYDSDICVSFARISGGTVFNTNNFVGGKQDAQKQFLHVVSSAIAESLASKKTTVEVTCSQKNGRPVTELLVDDVADNELQKVKGVKG